jgi:hypothetical protein
VTPATAHAHRYRRDPARAPILPRMFPRPTCRPGSRTRRVTVLGVLVALAVAALAYGAPSPRPPGRWDAGWRAATALAAGLPVPQPHRAATCTSGGGFGCAMAERLRGAAGYVAGRRGRLGVLIRDRRTGAVWRAGATAHRDWTASTIKLAIATDLLERGRAGRVRLTATDRARLAAMLATSSNEATDALWAAYGRDRMAATFRTRYGMTGLLRVPGDQPGWRGYQCTGEDLLRLVGYVLDRAAPAVRGYLVHALRTVAANQRWGVWAAGPALAPGNKNGWAAKPGPRGWHVVTHSVGFAGPGERYAVVVTDSLPPGVPMGTGVREVSEVVALAFGAPPPAVTTPPG